MKTQTAGLALAGLAGLAAVTISVPQLSLTGMFYADNQTNQSNATRQPESDIADIELNPSTKAVDSDLVRLPATKTNYTATLNSSANTSTIRVRRNRTRVVNLSAPANISIRIGNRSFKKQVLALERSQNNQTLQNTTAVDTVSANGTSDNQTPAKDSPATESVDNRSTNSTTPQNSNADTEEEFTSNATYLGPNDTVPAASRNATRESRPNTTLPEGMVEVGSGTESFYIFTYEASRADATADSEGDSPTPMSRQGVEPWNEISRKEASQACRRKGEGYRLPTREEWRTVYEKGVGGNTYLGSSGSFSSNETCSLSASSTRDEKYCLTGTGPDSWSTQEGVADMKGNLWEWTSTTETRELGGQDTELAVRAGGKWSTGEVSNLFIADRKPDHSSTDIGFRCIREG
jgi:hypothetical protein